MKILILYASTHHGNTKKVVEALAERFHTGLIDLMNDPVPDLASYDLLGFASGIYFGSFHKKILKLIEQSERLSGKKVFLLSTCGIGYKDYAGGIKRQLASKGADVLGSFQCRGYDTFGLWGKIGGIAKNHPNQKDRENAVRFLEKIIR